MSRIRSIHPGFFTDEDLVSVSMAARLLILGLGVEADDKGIFEWKPLTIKMRVFPGDNLDVVELLNELSQAGALRRYERGGKNYGAIRNFRKFQKPKTPNDIHPVSPEILAFVGLASEIEPHDEPPFPSGGETFPQNGEMASQMEDGGWRMEDGGSPSGEHAAREESSAKADPITPKPSKSKLPANVRMTADWHPDALPSAVAELTDQWPPGRLDREVVEFREYWLDRTDKRPGWDRTFHRRIRDIHDRVLRDSRNGNGNNSGGQRDNRGGAEKAIDRRLTAVGPHPASDTARQLDLGGGSGDGRSAAPRLTAVP